METLLNTLILGRIVERNLIVVIAGVAIGLGWELMRRRLSNSDAEIQHGDIRLALRNVGPGVLFAVFGAVVLAYAITHPIAFELAESKAFRDLATSPVDRATLVESKTLRLSQAANGDNGLALKMVVALNRALRVAEMKKNDQRVLFAAAEELANVRDPLTVLRDQIVIDRIGRDNFNFWRTHGAAFKQDEMAFSQADRDRLRALSQWFELE